MEHPPPSVSLRGLLLIAYLLTWAALFILRPGQGTKPPPSIPASFDQPPAGSMETPGKTEQGIRSGRLSDHEARHYHRLPAIAPGEVAK